MKEELKFFNDANADAPFNIRLAGISYCDGSYCIKRKNGDEFVLEYIIKGSGTVIENGIEHTASRGDVYLIHRGSDSKYFSSGNDPWTKMFFNIYGDLMDKLVESYRLSDRTVYRSSGTKKLFEKTYDVVCSDKSTDDIMLESAVNIHRILAALYKNAKDDSGHSSEAMALKEYLDKNIDKAVTIEELAASIYRSKDYAIKLFRREFAQTPYTYLTEKRLEAASYLLLNSQSSIKKIAYNVGYDDQHYFSNVFKKKFGVSPKAFRNSKK